MNGLIILVCYIIIAYYLNKLYDYLCMKFLSFCIDYLTFCTKEGYDVSKEFEILNKIC